MRATKSTTMRRRGGPPVEHKHGPLERRLTIGTNWPPPGAPPDTHPLITSLLIDLNCPGGPAFSAGGEPLLICRPTEAKADGGRRGATEEHPTAASSTGQLCPAQHCPVQHCPTLSVVWSGAARRLPVCRPARPRRPPSPSHPTALSTVISRRR